MEKEKLIAWVAGLFEGEGSFQISKGISKGIIISSTDLDVLKRVQDNFGGKIYHLTKRKEHWKEAWVWSIQGNYSINFYNLIEPYLLIRRKEKGILWLSLRPKLKDYDKVIDLFNEGKTHKEIGEALNIERSSVSHYLNRRGYKRQK